MRLECCERIIKKSGNAERVRLDMTVLLQLKNGRVDVIGDLEKIIYRENEVILVPNEKPYRYPTGYYTKDIKRIDTL